MVGVAMLYFIKCPLFHTQKSMYLKKEKVVCPIHKKGIQ